MYIFDKNVFIQLGNYYPNRFPTIWGRIDNLVETGNLRSVREVKKEIEVNCPIKYIAEWAQANSQIFMTPTEAELKIVTDIFKIEQYRGLVRKQNILKGLPVADPFIIAAGKFYDASIVTQESLVDGAARIPTICKKLDVKCTNLEGFLEKEDLKY
jgi:hypothetical protein